MAHTPGPWIVSGLLDSGVQPPKYESINADGPRAIATVYVHTDALGADPTCLDMDEARANARLIAAAPALLAALEGLVKGVEEFAEPDMLEAGWIPYDEARTAIKDS